jgi:hypothetical protein
MGFTTEIVTKVLENLAYMQKILIVEFMKKINEELASIPEEEAQRLVEYNEDLRTIALEIGNLIEKMMLDKSVDPKFADNIRALIISRQAKRWSI